MAQMINSGKDFTANKEKKLLILPENEYISLENSAIGEKQKQDEFILYLKAETS